VDHAGDDRRSGHAGGDSGELGGDRVSRMRVRLGPRQRRTLDGKGRSWRR
jgi:hypothetical protein